MEKYFDILSKCALFSQIDNKNIPALMGCIGAKIEKFPKNSTIFSEGDKPENIGIVLSGGVMLLKTDYYGNRSILSEVKPSDVFGECFACADISKMPVSAVASVDSEIMLVKLFCIMKSCHNACNFHQQIIFNLVKILAEKNNALHKKIEITSKRTTREKLMTYLMLEAKKQGKNSFLIPFDRQELADYLEVDRSGLSVEISKLRAEGVIESNKNKFTLL